ncbi:MAG: class I fructose-bisphosphate aldolase [bacterium]
MTPKVQEILSNYTADSQQTLANLERILMAGKLGGTGKLLILPVDQGFEHGPARSFAKNPPAYDPDYHFKLAINGGCSAYAAPLGFLEAGAKKYAKELPLILKLNNSDSLRATKNPAPAVTASVDDAIRLGCAAVGYTIYPGSSKETEMYEKLQKIAKEAKEKGLAVVVWSYPRGEDLSKEGETAIDVVAYAAQIACQMGAHIVKVKLPSGHIEQEAAKKVYIEQNIPITTQTERVAHIVQSAFAGKRIVIFSGGLAKSNIDELYKEIESIRDGGGYGSIIGRNVFQRKEKEALEILGNVIDIYKGEK